MTLHLAPGLKHLLITFCLMATVHQGVAQVKTTALTETNLEQSVHPQTDTGVPPKGNSVFSYGPDVMPEFPVNMFSYMRKKLRPFRIVRENNTGARVVVQFVVNKQGKAVDPEIIQSLNPDCDQAVLDMVNQMPDWKPGTKKGIPVDVHFLLPVSFKLQ